MREEKRSSELRKTTRKNKNDKNKIHIRIKLYLIMALFTLALLSFGIYRVYDIKFSLGQEYEARAIYNQVNKIQDKIINPNRGSIFDRNKQAFAVSSTVYTVVLDIRNLVKQSDEDKKATLNTLSELLEIPIEDLNEYISLDVDGKLKYDTNYKIIKKQVPYSIGKEIESSKIKCVQLEEDTKRNYPNGYMASQLIGFIRGDSSWGLESYYDEEMVGVPGRIFRTYEQNNSIVTRQESAQEGHSLITTIDQSIQQFAEKAAEKAYYEFETKNTSVMVMDPNTGEILAMAGYPNFDLNNPNSISLLQKADYKANWEKLTEEQKMTELLTAWRNFNISDTFEPGSIFKPLVVGAALEEGVISVNDTFYCGGSKQCADRVIHCHKRSGHGTQTLEQVLANSCNVGMMDIVNKLGREKFYKYQRDFGYGEKTGIDLPGEASAANLIYSLDMLNVVELATSSFGQGFNCTPIQALTSFAATINGGKLLKPYVVSKIIDKDGNIIKENSPKVVRKVFTEETSNYLRKAMESVVNEAGTGRKAKIDGYAIGGKTGTGEQGDRDKDIYTLSFIAYFPVENPQYLAISVLHHPKEYIEGVTTPTIMLKEVFLDIINYKAIPPTYPLTDKTTQTSNDNTTLKMPDYTNKSLLSAIQSLNSLGLDYQLVGGSGDTVTKQFPPANDMIPKGTKVLLYISSNDKTKVLETVPDLVGMTASEAQKTLEELGFACNVVEFATDEEDSENVEETTETEASDLSNTSEKEVKEAEESNKKVVVQFPEAGIKIEKGTIVKIKLIKQ